VKKILAIVLTLFILIGLSFGLSHYLQSNFFDYSFFVGLIVTVVIWFFSSKGGVTSRNLDMRVQSTMGMKTSQEKFEFSPNLAFVTSLLYTIFTFAATLFQYKDYF